MSDRVWDQIPSAGERALLKELRNREPASGFGSVQLEVLYREGRIDTLRIIRQEETIKIKRPSTTRVL